MEKFLTLVIHDRLFWVFEWHSVCLQAPSPFFGVKQILKICQTTAKIAVNGVFCRLISGYAEIERTYKGGRYDFLKKAESGTMARAKIFMDRYFEDGAIYNGHLVGNSDLSFCSQKNFKLTFNGTNFCFINFPFHFCPILCHWYGCQVTWNLNPNTSLPSRRTVVFRSISLATLTRGRWSWSFFPSKTM